MASDYGDEAGEKLFDWMLRMGQDASQDAIRASAVACIIIDILYPWILIINEKADRPTTNLAELPRTYARRSRK